MRILNLYACLGGNRYKWADDHEITAVEIDPFLCDLYKERFPNDTIICGDAHDYLLNNFQNFDFIWSSPPCPSHSRIRFSQAKLGKIKPVFPDLTLYQEIIFLQNYYDGLFCVENVIPFYEPLMHGKRRGRHIYWTNFFLPSVLSKRETPKIGAEKNEVEALSDFHEYDFRKYKGSQRIDKIARNLVDFEAGKTILDFAKTCTQKQLTL